MWRRIRVTDRATDLSGVVMASEGFSLSVLIVSVLVGVDHVHNVYMMYNAPSFERKLTGRVCFLRVVHGIVYVRMSAV